MKKKHILLVCFAVMLVVVLAASCNSGGSKTPPSAGGTAAAPDVSHSGSGDGGEQRVLGFATGGTGGTYYVVGGGIASLVEQKMPGTKMLVATSSSSMENVRLLANKEADFAICRPDNVWFALAGQREFTSETKIEDLRAIMLGHSSNVQPVVLASSGIESFADLKGKRVSLAPKSSPAVYIALACLEAYGLTVDDIQPQYLTLAETADSLKSGAIDCGFFISAAPTSSVLDLAATFDIRILPFDEEKIDQTVKDFPFAYKDILPANTYPGQTEDIWQLRDPCILMTYADMDEQLVYDVIKLIVENTDYLGSIHPAGYEWGIDGIIAGLGDIPLHPGAERYLRESGVIQ